MSVGRGILVAGMAGKPEADYLFTHLITRVTSVDEKTSIVHMLDGSKYTFKRSAKELIDIIFDEQYDDNPVLITVPGTDTVQ